MQVTLYRALKSINIDDDTAQKAVEVVEEHVTMNVAQAVRPLESKIDALVTQVAALTAKIDTVGSGNQMAISSLRNEVATTKWVAIGTVGLISVAGTAAGIAKLFF